MSKPYDKYAAFRTRLYLPEELSDLAKQWFPLTRYGSMSGFVKAKIREEIKNKGGKMRQAGISVPMEVLQ